MERTRAANDINHLASIPKVYPDGSGIRATPDATFSVANLHVNRLPVSNGENAKGEGGQQRTSRRASDFCCRPIRLRNSSASSTTNSAASARNGGSRQLDKFCCRDFVPNGCQTRSKQRRCRPLFSSQGPYADHRDRKLCCRTPLRHGRAETAIRGSAVGPSRDSRGEGRDRRRSRRLGRSLWARRNPHDEGSARYHRCTAVYRT